MLRLVATRLFFSFFFAIMFLGPIVTAAITSLLLAFFGYQTHKAIAGGAAETTHWLTFWTLYGFFQILEAIADTVMWRMPFYFELKLACYVWLGVFGGAQVVYEKFGKSAINAGEAQMKQASEHPQVKQALHTVNSKLEPFMGSKTK